MVPIVAPQGGGGEAVLMGAMLVQVLYERDPRMVNAQTSSEQHHYYTPIEW